MKNLALILAMGLAASTMTAIAAPEKLTVAEMSTVVAGKKDSSTPGNGNDTNLDGSSNYVYQYTSGSKTKYLDYDSGGGNTNTWSCVSYGYFSSGTYVFVNYC